MTDTKPFAEPNYTQFSNDAIDIIMREVSPNAWKIITVAIRQTYGWHKEADTISLSQFQKKTGIKNRSTVVTSIGEVLDKGILLRSPAGNSFEYSLNKNYIVQKLDQIANSPKIGLADSPKIEPPDSPKIGHTKEREKKEQNKIVVVVALYQKNVGVIVPKMLTTLEKAVTEYPIEWFEEAFEIAVKADARRWNYVEGVLKNWKTKGRGKKKKERGKDRSRYTTGKFAEFLE